MKVIKKCKECKKLSVDPMFCLHCGSANIEPVSNDLPFK